MDSFPQPILSDPQLTAIKNHRYVGGTYTPIDNLLNPAWLALTELLPMTMAPNLVTLVGWFHILFMWGLVTVYAPTEHYTPPNLVFLVAAWCLLVYQTMDAMDGKQARRTGSSSPLGQLFDHGCDATSVFLVIHSITTMASLSGTRMQLFTVAGGILTFFVAQWQEYHLHVLPHAVGPFGVTEQQLFAVGLFLITAALGTGMWTVSLPLPFSVTPAQLVVYSQLGAMVSTSSACIFKVRHKLGPGDVKAAMLHLVSPTALALMLFTWPVGSVQSYPVLVLLPGSLALLHLCCKIIVFSMAKAPYATLHLEELTPVLLPWAMDFLVVGSAGSDTSKMMLGLSAVANLCMFGHFIRTTIRELCDFLKIHCFTIKSIN
eukprot:TRINITY_DN7903_c0_g2_i11.p1 TRINITY_DN7903_c0_g2~~TRINITY_DN7903_c0_g2_i11.p1  ORF type:complete len:375 (+),score=61.81 TRINITY_DN7903_c0_g2_i11:60-1184(+)